MSAEHVLTPDDRCPCGEPQEGSGYCSYECFSKFEMGAPIEPYSASLVRCEECARPDRGSRILTAQPLASAPETSDGNSGTGTGVAEAPGTAQAIESGRQIAVSMMDRAEAKYRHEHGQPHLREHCETCAEEYWSDRLRPVHYRELAESLDHVHPEATRLIRSHVKDLEDNE